MTIPTPSRQARASVHARRRHGTTPVRKWAGRIAAVLVAGIAALAPVAAFATEPMAAGQQTGPGWSSILPPLVAIGLALVTRQIIPSLLAGVWLGAWLVEGLTIPGLMTSLLDTGSVHVVDQLTDPDQAVIIVFTMMVGGLVGLIRRNGGMDAIVGLLTTWASTARRGQVATAGMGVGIFFDDYANTLVVGNTMRPLTDRLRISREKLAYIVDSTAAPVATLALVSTWTGFQVGLVDDAIARTGLQMSGFSVFIESLRYAFYPILAIVFVFAVAWMGRDFGPMLRAERRASQTGQVLRADSHLGSSVSVTDDLQPVDAPRRLLNAVLPIVVLVCTTLVGLVVTGEGATIIEVVGSGDAFSSLLWGAMLAIIVAAALSIGQGIMSVGQTVDAWFAGVKSVLYVLIILVLAWALSALTSELGTAQFLAGALGQAIPAELLPAILFVTAASVAFATGTSWGTMGILTPLAVPLAWTVLQTEGLAAPDGHPILFASVSTILAGAVWGDHCSPVSDTTVLSSLASQCDVVDHVRTQLPYALFVGAVAVVVGLVPIGFGMPWWLALPVTAAVLPAGLYIFGRSTAPDDEPNDQQPPAVQQPAGSTTAPS